MSFYYLDLLFQMSFFLKPLNVNSQKNQKKSSATFFQEKGPTGIYCLYFLILILKSLQY